MIIGLEGVSCAGKTSLARALETVLDAPVVVPCYYHSAPDPSQLPSPVARSAERQLQGLRPLLEIEGHRRELAVRAAAEGRDVILDRTIDTLLAHTYAVGRLQRFAIDDAARRMALETPVVVPDLTLLLQAPPGVLTARAAARPGLPAIFYAPQFTEHFHDYFRLPLAPSCCILASGRPTQQVLANALTHIRQARSRAHTAGSGDSRRTS